MAKRPGFGSFHSDNVEDMIKDSSWVAPAEPIDVSAPENQDEDLKNFQFGRKALSYFLLDPDWTFVNHGAFGSPLSCAFESASRWRLHAERQPLKFVDRELFPHMVRSLKMLAKHMDCSPKDLALVPNATLALNSIFNSVPLTSADSIFYFDCTYNSVKKMIKAACERTGAIHVQKDLPFPLPPGRENESIIEAVQTGLPSDCKLAVFDHVTSNEGLLMPVRELVQLCHSRGVLVLIDGAHGLGSVHPFSPAQIGCEYYAGNCHKWLSSVRGCGFLHVNHQRLRDIADVYQKEGEADKGPSQPMVCSDKTCERGGPEVKTVWGAARQPIISHGHGQGFASEFIWDGARDYSAALTLPACIAFWERIGWEKALAYTRALLSYAVDRMARRWGHDGGLFPMSLCCNMALVPLPPEAKALAGNLGDAARCLQDALHDRAVECPAKVVGGRLYVRISAWVYNEPADYLRLARAVDEVVGSKGEGDGAWAETVESDAVRLRQNLSG